MDRRYYFSDIGMGYSLFAYESRKFKRAVFDPCSNYGFYIGAYRRNNFASSHFVFPWHTIVKGR